MYILSKDEGGRHNSFFSATVRSSTRTTDVTGTTELPEGVEMVMPGDNIKMGVTPDPPDRDGRRSAFRNREGGRTVGAGGCYKVLG
ncbi:hypothetical protein MJ579_01840 [Klebsiella pneumoniae]|nr:hypothetical protein MJ579_01840 [Klebsiella pneumoniae]